MSLRTDANRPSLAMDAACVWRWSVLHFPTVTIAEAFAHAVQIHQAGRLADAERLYRQILAVDPRHSQAMHMLGVVAIQAKRSDVAVELIREAIRLVPTDPGCYRNLGVALSAAGEAEEALAAFRMALRLQPDSAQTHYNLGKALLEQGRVREAVEEYRQAVALRSDYAEAYNNLGYALKEQGRLADAVAAYRRAIEIQPAYPEAHSNLLLDLHYLPDADPRELFAEHCRWEAVHALQWATIPGRYPNTPQPDRRLRVGYVSPDFRQHPVAAFLEGLFAATDASAVELFCYADVSREDAVGRRLRQYAAHWRTIAGMPDGQVAGLIRQDRIDILVDLAGHTVRNRLLVFARKPAPVQVTYLGYPDTTGLRAMDYRLTDGCADPPGATEQFHREHLLRLPHCAWCYRPPADAPPVSPRPLARAGHVAFGCFNAHQKINEPLLALWAEILHQVPDAGLILKNRLSGDASMQKEVRARLQKSGVAPERIEIAPPVFDFAEHLAAYGRMDIALDTFPYHGTTTTCEALWMGVPVVTLAGKTHASRVGVSLLTHAGLPELIAGHAEQYVRIACELAGDPTRLTGLRANLRERMARAPLMDAPGFARDVEQAYRQIWRAWCEQPPALTSSPQR